MEALELLEGHGEERIAEELRVQAVDVRLEARGVDRAAVRRAHRRAVRGGRVSTGRGGGAVSGQAGAHISCGVKIAFSSAWFHILRRFLPSFLV